MANHPSNTNEKTAPLIVIALVCLVAAPFWTGICWVLSAQSFGDFEGPRGEYYYLGWLGGIGLVLLAMVAAIVQLIVNIGRRLFNRP